MMMREDRMRGGATLTELNANLFRHAFLLSRSVDKAICFQVERWHPSPLIFSQRLPFFICVFQVKYLH